MPTAQSPRDGARSRYTASFTSSIFDTSAEPARSAFVPAGKRRDQTTSEMFGTYDEKDLRGMPKTFAPKDDGVTARQMKQAFLSSEVLPCAAYPAPPAPERPQRPRLDDPSFDPYAEDSVCTREKRHTELSSGLFGRKTPAAALEQTHCRSARLTPNDFKWHNHPEHLRGPGGGDDVTHADRAYQEKCSTVFGHRSPEARPDVVDYQREREQDSESELKRRTNAYYSDLFGRSTPMDVPAEVPGNSEVRRPKHQSSHEDKIAVHQDWMDSKTELMGGMRSSRPEHPALRKSDELYQSRIFGHESSYQPPERIEQVSHDNSQKLRSAFGRTPQQIHQAHMRTSMQPDEFYHDADKAKQWEVVELHVSGLPINADDKQVRRLCQGFDLQLVKVAVEMDPVRNLCKGRGKIMVRHNTRHDAVADLVQKLEESSLRVEV